MKNKNNMKTKFLTFIFISIISGYVFGTVPPEWFKKHNKSFHTKNSGGCAAPAYSSVLELNNVRTTIHTGGDMWWDLLGNPRYEIPKGSGKHSLFLGGIWIGGTDVNGQLRVSAVRYRANGTDYYTGPLIVSGPNQGTTTPEECEKYDKHFRIKRSDVAKFRTWITAYLNGTTDELGEEYDGYTIPDAILNWPAHGDEALGYDHYLAPFYDNNNDGYYNPMDGDYPYFDLDGELPCGTTPEERVPRLYGDETLWWVYNDRGNVHNESKGEAIGMEIRAQAFAFATSDELNNMTFYHYELINRSTYTLENCYFGVNNDADIGNYADDYTGCDVKRGMGYVYNGDEDDDGAKGYGKHPPAIGIDFFEGPYQDPDGSDYGASGLPPDGGVNACDESINGLNFGDGKPDNERWGMRRFVYYINGGGNQGDPETATEYYNYLRGYWKDGVRMTFGGDGHSGTVVSDFMFPGQPTTDPCGWGTGGVQMGDWSEITAGNQPGDRRFVQSAGPFTLKPGAVNDLTLGAVWARANGTAWQSVVEVQRADDMAQALFEHCFKVVDGPDAPSMKVIELDRKLVFYMYYQNPSSNNYGEKYAEEDPFITCPLDPNTGEQTDCDRIYRFQGYQVYQLKDATCSVNDIGDPSKAKLVFQCDIKDGVSRLVNFIYDGELGYDVPQEMVNGADQGLQHSFVITQDAFAAGDKRLVNHKQYYFVAIAYAYNNFKQYDPTDPQALDGQKKPYLAGRKGEDGGQIKVYAVMPHKTENTQNGTILNSTYGEEPPIVQVEGHGNGMNIIDLDPKTESKILDLTPGQKLDEVTYKKGYGPIKVQVVDPIHLKAKDFVLKFDSTKSTGPSMYSGYINDVNNTSQISKWYVEVEEDNKVIWSDKWISFAPNEYLLPDYGISINIYQVTPPGRKIATTAQGYEPNPEKHGFLTASMTFSDVQKQWLMFLPDQDGNTPQNWIRSGTHQESTNDHSPYDDFLSGSDWYDPNEDYEGILNGTWAPGFMTATDQYVSFLHYGVRPDRARTFYEQNGVKLQYSLPSIDFVITKDKSKWTRSPVIETCEFDTVNGQLVAGPSEGRALKYHLRKHASVDKYGRTDNIGDENNPNYSNFVADSGMGWFPGYAIDVESGIRLNIIFGEDSKYQGENGRDMIWNPTSDIYSDLYWYTGGNDGDVYFGGKHYIYVISKPYFDPDNTGQVGYYVPEYDYGKTIYEKLATDDENEIGKVFANAAWISIPLLNPNFKVSNSSDPYAFIQSDVRIKIRMANPYRISVNGYAKSNPVNGNRPMYRFSTKGLEAVTDDLTTAQDALDLIRVVPNPYYGYSEYETSAVDNRVRIINLPKKCTISIYNVSGTLIRRYKKDSEQTYQDWDLKNEYGITVASGVYIIHIDAPGIGEKVLKWFGALRPMDLIGY